MRRPDLLLLDGHSLAYRAFFALPVENFSTHDRAAHQRGVRLHVDADQRVARRAAHAHHRGRFDVSRQSFRTEQYAEYKAGRSETPRPFKGQVSLVKEVLDALRIPVVEKPGYEADDVIATLATQARDGGHGGADLHRRPRRVPAGRASDVTVLYPVRGVSELARMTPAAVEAKYGVPPDALPRPGRAGRRDQRQPAGRARRRREDRGQVDQRSTAASTASIANVDKIKGKVGDSLRAHLADVLRNYEINKLVVRPRAAAATRRTLRWRGWDREAVHQVFDALEFRVLRDRLYEYLDAVEPEAESGFDLDRRGALRPARSCRAGSSRTPRRARRSASRWPGRFGRGTGELTGVALATADGPAAWFDPADARRGRRGRRWRPGSPTRAAQGDPRQQAGAARRSPRAAGSWPASAATPRSPPTWRGPTSAPTTWPTWRCATCTASCGSTRPSTASSRSTASATSERGRAKPDAPGPGHARPGRRAATPSCPATASCRRGCWPRSSCRWSRCWPAWSAPASPPTPTTSPSWSRTSPPR